jgi:hypothetical protein
MGSFAFLIALVSPALPNLAGTWGESKLGMSAITIWTFYHPGTLGIASFGGPQSPWATGRYRAERNGWTLTLFPRRGGKPINLLAIPRRGDEDIVDVRNRRRTVIVLHRVIPK